MTSATPTTYEHIVLDETGVPWIEGANTKIVELVAASKAHGWSAEELAYQHPHLTLGQVHSALAYYWDHREEIEADLTRRAAIADEIRSEVGEHPLVAKLRGGIIDLLGQPAGVEDAELELPRLEDRRAADRR